MDECCYCELPGQGNYELTGLGKVGRVTLYAAHPLCDECGEGAKPTAEEISAKLARDPVVQHGGKDNKCCNESRKPEHDFECIHCGMICCWCFGSACEVDEKQPEGKGLCCECWVLFEADNPADDPIEVQG